MRVIVCSDHLQRREESYRQAAQELQEEPLPRPKGLWQRLVWLVTARRTLELAARNARVSEMESEANRFAQGRDGEDAFVRALTTQLDDRYVLLKGYRPPPPWQQGGDIDGLLVGPHGVSVIEVKAWRGFYRYSGEDWLFRKNRRAVWEVARKNPTAQATANTQRIEHVLEDADLGHIHVFASIAAATETMNVEIIPPVRVPLYLAYLPGARLDAIIGPSGRAVALSLSQVEQVLAVLMPPATIRAR
jgi:Nuclease-related domain